MSPSGSTPTLALLLSFSMQGSHLAPARSVRLTEDRIAVLSSTSVACNQVASCADSLAPALHNGQIHHFVLVLHSAGASHSGSPGRATVSAQLFVVHQFPMFGTCPCITACVISTVFNILLMFAICFCIQRSSPLNCTCVVSTAFWRCRLHRWSVHPLRRTAGT